MKYNILFIKNEEKINFSLVEKILQKYFSVNSIECVDKKDLLNNCKSRSIDVVIFTSSISETNRNSIIRLQHFDKNKIFIFDINLYNNIALNQLDSKKIIYKYNEYAWIDKVQVPVATHCNLKCNRCYHFSNLQNKEQFYDLEQYKIDLLNFKNLNINVYEFRFLGGEPLLCDNLLDYILYTKELFQYSIMKIITNGILILKLDDSILKSFAKYNIEISISVYPPVIKIIDKIEKRLKQYNIKYEIFRYGDIFNKILLREKNVDTKKVAKQCEKCVIIYNSKISRCAPSIFINIFNKKFNYNYPENNDCYITMFKNRKELLSYLNKPLNLCGYCTGDSNPISCPWEITKDPSAKDYIR